MSTKVFPLHRKKSMWPMASTKHKRRITNLFFHCLKNLQINTDNIVSRSVLGILFHTRQVKPQIYHILQSKIHCKLYSTEHRWIIITSYILTMDHLNHQVKLKRAISCWYTEPSFILMLHLLPLLIFCLKMKEKKT